VVEREPRVARSRSVGEQRNRGGARQRIEGEAVLGAQPEGLAARGEDGEPGSIVEQAGEPAPGRE
jgi:hypothetical protein